MVKKKTSSDSQATHPATHPATLDNEEQIIFDYLTRQNRPYSAVDIFNNLHGAVGRAGCTRALASLAERSLIHHKAYGKQTVFVARQDSEQLPTSEELLLLDSQIEETKRQLGEQNEEIARLQTELHAITSTLPTDKLRVRIEEVKKQIQEKSERLESLRAGGKRVDPLESAKVVKEGENLAKLLSQRRRLCMNVVEGILDGAGEALGKKNAREFMEEIGCELD